MSISSKPKMNQRFAWFIISLSALFLLYKYILQISPSIMAGDLMRHFSINATELGNLAATYFYSYMIFQLIAGYLLDTYNPRLIIAFAILSCALGTAIFAQTHSLIFAVIGRIMVGFGVSFATVSYMKMTSLLFTRDKMAIADGLLATAAMLGALCAEVPLSLLVGSYGWQKSLLICSVFGAGLAFLFYSSTKKINELDNETNHAMSLDKFLTVLKKKDTLLLTIYSGLAFTPITVLGGLWGNSFVGESYQLSSTESASVMSMLFLGLAVGGPFFGYLANKFNTLNVTLFGTAFSCISLLMLLCLPHLPITFMITLLFNIGFGTGAYMLCFVLGKEWNNVKYAACVISIINTGDALVGSISEPLVGKLLDLGWNHELINGVHHFSSSNFKHAFLVLPLYYALAMICLFTLKKIKKAEKNNHEITQASDDIQECVIPHSV